MNRTFHVTAVECMSVAAARRAYETVIPGDDCTWDALWPFQGTWVVLQWEYADFFQDALTNLYEAACITRVSLTRALAAARRVVNGHE